MNMPTYTSQCLTCKATGSIQMSFSEYRETKAGERKISCSECSQEAEIVFNPGKVAFVLKDGHTGGWVSKAGKEKAYRAKRNVVMAQREKDHVFKSKHQPNYKGQETGTWKDAQQAAYQDRFDAVKQEHGSLTAHQAALESAKSYDPLVKGSLA